MEKTIRIVLISIDNVWRYGNIGIDQLTGFLREQGYNVLLKHYANKLDAGKILDDIPIDFDVYGFSVTSANYNKCVNLCNKLKEVNSKAVIVFGGGLVSRYYKEIMENTESIDYITLGDGEMPTQYLFDYINVSKINKNAKWIPHESVVSRGDYSNKKDALNTEITFFPAFDYYEQDTSARNTRKVHCIQTKNNVCTGNCSFCTERHGKIFYKEIDSIINQIKTVYNRFGVRKFYFTDDNILDPNDQYAKERLSELCSKIISLNYPIAFQCYIKAISIRDCEYDHALLDLMKKAGFVEVFVGLESGNQHDLDLYNKHTTVADNYCVMKMLYQHGLFPVIGFIGFNPYSTQDSIKINFRFLCNINCSYLFNYIYTFVVINKYTSLYYMSRQDGLLLDDNCFIDIPYKFQDERISRLLEYVRNRMIPELNKLDYQLDYVTYSFFEHKIQYLGVKDYSSELLEMKQTDCAFIEKYLSILFEEQDVAKFDSLSNAFWSHFREEETRLKEIYNYLISLHYD